MTSEAPTTIPSGADYREAEAIARKMSDLDLLRVARSLSSVRCNAREMAANHEVNRRFERLRERSLLLKKSLAAGQEKHDRLQERFDKMLTVLQRVLALLAGPEAWPGGPPPGELADSGGDAPVATAGSISGAPVASDTADAPDERRPLAG